MVDQPQCFLKPLADDFIEHGAADLDFREAAVVIEAGGADRSHGIGGGVGKVAEVGLDGCGGGGGVGTANGMNRIAIVVPCHRVVNADGKLGGYGGGVWRKQFLLDLERGQRTLGA